MSKINHKAIKTIINKFIRIISSRPDMSSLKLRQESVPNR
jgi:hypothetical protein